MKNASDDRRHGNGHHDADIHQRPKQQQNARMGVGQVFIISIQIKIIRSGVKARW